MNLMPLEVIVNRKTPGRLVPVPWIEPCWQMERATSRSGRDLLVTSREANQPKPRLYSFERAPPLCLLKPKYPSPSINAANQAHFASSFGNVMVTKLWCTKSVYKTLEANKD